MPRHPESPPHLDPFPPLPSLSRPPNPTYASITASSSRPPLPSPGPPQLGWSAEDVDRSERLDELNPYPSVIPAGPSPPWRRGETAAGPSTPTAQSRRASRMITPMFTLDELLGNANPSPPSGPPRPRAPSEPATVTSGAHRHYANPFSLPGYQDVWPSGDARRERQGSWDGPSDAARRLGYVPAPTTISAPATSNTTAARGETDGPMGTVARRHRPRIFRPSHPAYDPEEVLPSPNDLYAMENEDGEGEDHPWLVRSGRARLYQHENTTGDDLDGWGRAEGSATGSLSRGRNNRRRRSLVERREAEEDERVGLQPTNVDVARGSEPLIVRSNGVRRQREESEVEVINGLATKLRKRRKLEAIQKATVTVPSHYPGYLSYSTLDPSTPLPCSFVPPTRPSRLALTTIFVPGRPGPMRPKITFTTHPTPRQNDTDAAALRTHEPIPVSCGVHYFEAEVLNQGEEGFMSIGWMKAGLELGRLVGWDRGSWGWHGDDGMSFEGAPLGESFSEKWGSTSASSLSSVDRADRVQREIRWGVVLISGLVGRSSPRMESLSVRASLLSARVILMDVFQVTASRTSRLACIPRSACVHHAKPSPYPSVAHSCSTSMGMSGNFATKRGVWQLGRER